MPIYLRPIRDRRCIARPTFSDCRAGETGEADVAGVAADASAEKKARSPLGDAVPMRALNAGGCAFLERATLVYVLLAGSRFATGSMRQMSGPIVRLAATRLSGRNRRSLLSRMPDFQQPGNTAVPESCRPARLRPKPRTNVRRKRRRRQLRDWVICSSSTRSSFDHVIASAVNGISRYTRQQISANCFSATGH